MKKEPVKNYAFIDSQNLNLSIKDQGWILDLRRFRVYLKEKYGVNKAFLFLGYVPKYKKMYAQFKKFGYLLVFKPTLASGVIKGNVDAEIILHAMIERDNYDKAVLVSGDGDFYCLVEYLIKKRKLLRLLVPNLYSYSSLLKRFMKYIDFMNGLRNKLAYGTKKRGINLRTEP